MKRIRLLLSIICFGLVGEVDGQKYNKLQIGDKFPDELIKYIGDKSINQNMVSNLDGKLIILDFWDKNCVNCIVAFPKMEKLQKDFDGKIQVVLITPDQKEEVAFLFTKYSFLRSISLPMIFGDTVFNSIFPHRGVPFHVWIDHKKTVRIKTSGPNTNHSNIQDALDGKYQKIFIQEDQVDFNYEKPLILEGDGRQWNHLQFYSMFMRGIVGTNESRSGIIKDPINQNEKGLRFMNISPLSLFAFAYNASTFGGRTFVLGKHKIDFYRPSNPDEIDIWRDTMALSYEIYLTKEMMPKLKALMQQDLERYFGLRGIFKNAVINTFVLYRTTSIIKPLASGGEELTDYTNTGIILRNQPIQAVVLYLKKGLLNTKDEPYIIDETNFKGNLDITLNSTVADLVGLNKELSRFGLGVKQEKRLINCFFIE